MHYVPESSRALLEGESPAASADSENLNFHLASAPVYVLTAAVGLLLLADIVIGASGDPAWGAYRTLFGFRLALLAAVLGGARILFHTLEGILSGRVGADLALTIACLAAIALGEHSVAALVVFIALCGESIEGYTVDRATSAIKRIFNLCPRQAHVIREGREIDVPIEQIGTGEEVVVRPGERVPVDGKVISGTTAVDQSALTGESLPIDKAAGDEVFAGTLNQFGAIVVTVSRVGEDTTFGQVVQMVAAAMARKAPLERTADRLARYFLPVVLLAAGATLIGWRIKTGTWNAGWLPALGVLVVACPCPLVLATPSAVMAAMAWLARSGVVIKGSIALERLASIDTIAFDKTGTLTEGRLEIADVLPSENLDATELLRLAAAAERPSEHLLARTIVTAAEARNVVVPQAFDFAAQPGLGVSARVSSSVIPESLRCSESENCTLVVGNRRLIESQGTTIDAAWDDRLAEFDRRGQTPLFVLLLTEHPIGTKPDNSASRVPSAQAANRRGTLLGIIGVRDKPRAEAAVVIRQLRELGVGTVALLTGDRRSVADEAAREIGQIDEIGAELLPADKARWVEEQLAAGRRVAMIGDGINDAPALAAASVGVALAGVGSDLAAEAGDMILMGPPLAPLPGLVRLSRQMVLIIKQGIYLFAFGMNGLGVLLCAWGVLNPVGGALFHEFASLAVMLNALRLLWFERWETTRFGRAATRALLQTEWLADSLSPTRILHGLIARRRLVARLCVALALFLYLASNCVLLTEDEQALVTRFGRYETTLGAGLHWRWPAPFERLRREKVDLLRAVQLGFRAERSPQAAEGAFVRPVEWQAEHTTRGYLAVPAESSLLAGDEVALELTAEAHYRIRDLRAFVEGASDPAELLRSAAESATRQVVAARALEEILAEHRSDVEADCLAAVREAIAPYRLGIEVVSFMLLDVHPPPAVVPSYRDVANAIEEQEQSINVAQALYARTVLSTAGEPAIRLLRQREQLAGKDKHERATGGTLSDWKLDEQAWKRLTSEEQGAMALSGRAAARLLGARREATRTVSSAQGERSHFENLVRALRAEPTLTRGELYWEALERALAGRPLTILDPSVAGRTHLFMVEPEQLKTNLLNGLRLPEEPAPPQRRIPPDDENEP